MTPAPANTANASSRSSPHAHGFGVLAYSALGSLESAAFAAWPALQETLYQGWHLRFAKGYTKRANSANPSANAGKNGRNLALADIAHIEAAYQQQQLKPIFRITSFAGLEATDDLLAERGYQLVDPSLVLTMPLATVAASDGTASISAIKRTQNAADWLTDFQSVAGKIGSDQTTHLQILHAIAQPHVFASLYVDATPVCCGLAVLVENQLGLFDIATHRSYRRQGLARQLCQALLAWGSEHGAHTAYLQVTGSNQAAIALYQDIGFANAYRYWYRVMDMG